VENPEEFNQRSIAFIQKQIQWFSRREIKDDDLIELK
jgi:hypothetical protein